MKTRAAFTLVELLVVIAIVAVLAALLFPAVMRALAKGDVAKCQSNLSTIVKAYTSSNIENASTPGQRPGLPVNEYLITLAGNTIKDNGEPCGPALLLPLNDPTTAFDVLWCPGIKVPGARQEAMEDWLHGQQCGGGYLYMWLDVVHFQEMLDSNGNLPLSKLSILADQDMASARSSTAVLMDINYEGEDFGSKWRSHPRLHVVNVAYLDGHVRAVKDNPDLVLPVNHQAEDWIRIFKEASRWAMR